MTSNPESSQNGSLFLPSLKPRSQVKPGAPGRWDAQESRAFEDVAKSLDYQAPGATRGISAVPTLWARPLLVEMTLHDTDHPLHEEMVNEWQGMMAALALAHIRSFPLRAVFFELKKLQGQQPFANALLKLLPIAPENNLYSLKNQVNPWEEIYLFFWNGKPVGMTSPSTLVVPSEEADWGALPWWKNEPGKREYSRLTCPVPFLSEEEKALLSLWLGNIETNLPSQGKAADRVRALLINFRDRLGESPEGQSINESLVSKSDYFGVTFNRGCLDLIGKPLKRSDRPSTVSLALRPQQVQSQTQGVRAPALLIVDPDIAEQWNIPPQEITVHRGDTLAALSSLSPQDWAKRQRDWGNEVRCVTKADLFLPRLTFIAQGPPAQVFPGAIVPQIVDRILFNDVEITPLLPLNPILMSYFASEALASAVEMEPITTGKGAGVKVTLRLPLAGLTGEGKEFALSQIYDLEEENAIDDLPFLEIWPNFRTRRMTGEKLEHSTWNTYYAFYGDNYADTFRVYLPTLAPEASASYEYKDGKQGFQLDRLTDFPSYVQCQNAERQPIGLLLLQTPPTIDLTATWTVGFDFGTSSTNAYVNTGNAVEKIQLRDLSYRVTEMPESDRALVLPEFFMFTDAFTGNLPMSTVLTTRKNRSHLNRDDQQVMFDGRYYIPNLEFFDVREQYVKTGLKLDSRTEEHDRHLFLKHFLLHITAIAAEAGVAEINWQVSFPSAFSLKERRFYKQLWEKLLDDLNPLTGIYHAQPTLETESLAAGRYFADVERLDLLQTTCIDIGGGTSDISLWQNRDLIHQCSVQLAGRDLFTGILHRKPDFVTRQLVKAMNLGERNTLSDLKQWENLRDTAFNAKLDLFLRRFNDGLLKKRSQSEFEDSEEFQGLTTLISVGFAGLFYYVGMILSALYQEKTYGHPGITPVYLGGNGSRFLNWLDATGRFDRDSDINRFLSRMLSCGSGFEDIGVETRLSRDLKSEASCGLVQTRTDLTGLDKPEPFLVAGEMYCFGSEHRSALARVQFDPEFDDINSFAIPELEQLPKFLYDFHSTLKEFSICPKVEGYKLSLNQADNADLWRKVKRKLDDSLLDLKQDRQKKTKRAGEDVRLEPPFILALKALLNELGERWATQKFEP